MFSTFDFFFKQTATVELLINQSNQLIHMHYKTDEHFTVAEHGIIEII